MAEMIRTFTNAKMNKDLDERLVPAGEYRDALNVEIASTSKSDVGAFQNLKGNLERANKSYDPSTRTLTPWGNNEGYISSLNNPICIGSIADDNNEKIYWFIASETVSAIAVYNVKTQVTSPLLVDTQGILNFSSEYLITGINIVEDMLIWTDNQTEPKKINIEDYVNSTINFETHSQIYNRDFIEQDITVIKTVPLQPPVIEAAITKKLNASGNPATITTQTTYAFYQEFPVGSGNVIALTADDGPQTLTWSSSQLPYFEQDDVLLLTPGSNDPLEEDNLITVIVQSVIGTGNNQTGAIVLVQSVEPSGGSQGSATTDPVFYDVELQQKSPFFEFKFARFGYRWKFKSNEQSVFSPFTNPIFLPGEFDYSPRQGYNLGMVNNVRQITIKDFITSDMPDDVVGLDILYKDTSNQNVYVVDSFSKDDDQFNPASADYNTFNIETEIITSVVQSNQILRPYDNVPRWARAQEITANRLIYANYTQNFNILNSQGNPLTIDLSCNVDPLEAVPNADNILVGQSVKTIRTYQLGVAYLDQYGRTTPVFTSNNGALIIDKINSNKFNKIQGVINTSLPYYNQSEQFTNFKYYIKETSQEYYNLALDRWYRAEDNNIWLSFPSAERNKVDEETFLILKKGHDNSVPITEEARYKIIAIENEAPIFLKQTRYLQGTLGGQPFLQSGFPIEGTLFVDVDNTSFEEEFGDDAASTSGMIMRVTQGTRASNWYDISNFAKPTNSVIRITSRTIFGPDMNFTSTEPYGYGNAVGGLALQIAKVETINKPEFTGRFFVKINEDAILTRAIEAAGAESNLSYYRKAVAPIYWTDVKLREGQGVRNWWRNSWGSGDAQGNTTRFFLFDNSGRTDCEGSGYYRSNTWTNFANDGEFTLCYAGNGHGGVEEGRFNKFCDELRQVGALFRWVNDPEQTIYEITEFEGKSNKRTYACSSSNLNYDEMRNKIGVWKFKFKQSSQGWGGLLWSPVGPILGNNGRRDLTNYAEMEFLGINPEDDSFTTNDPAIFETEPKEATELNIYYEIPGIYDASEHGNLHTLDWYNCFSFGNGVESDRIRDDFNAATLNNGVRASATLDEPYEQETRFTGLIYSQIFNSMSGINGLNQFIQAESITKDLLPEYGSIQKLYSRDTNLVTLCEEKSLWIAADKDILYNAGGNAQLTASNKVLGTSNAFKGEYGISTNPESFAQFGYRMYYTDRERGAVIRLSMDGITEISSKGLAEFFNNNLVLNTSSLIGGWDNNKKEYNLSLNNLTPYWQNTLAVGQRDRLNDDPNCPDFVTPLPTTSTTLSFREDTDGWTSRKVFMPESSVSLNNNYYTFKAGRIWEHGKNDLYNTFYNFGPNNVKLGAYYESSVNLIFNDMPQAVKEFKTFNYSGTESYKYIYKVNGYGAQNFSLAQLQSQRLIPNSVSTSPGWYTQSVITDLQEGQIKEFLNKEGKYFNYVKGIQTFYNTNCDNNVDSNEFNVQGIGRASTITGDTEITSYTVTTFIDPSCFTAQQAPVLQDQSFIGVEDTVLNIQLIENNICASGITFQLITDSTTGGTLGTLNADGSVSFTPDPNWYGEAGKFTVVVCCNGVCSNQAVMTIEIQPVPEAPYFTTNYPSLDGLTAGDCWEYSPIGVADPDHAATDLVVTWVNLPSWMNDPQQILDSQGNPTGEWEIPSSCVPANTPAGNIDFTLTVTDPDNLTGTQNIAGNTLLTALQSVEFVITSRPAQQPRTYTDPVTGIATPMVAMDGTSHACNRGTYIIGANGQNIGRAYVGNSQGVCAGPACIYSQYDSYGWDINNANVNNFQDGPTSPTGDVEGSTPIPSAIAQGTTTTLLTASTQPNQKYITSADNFLGGSQNRYNYITIDETEAQNIMANSSGPNPELVTFSLTPDTWRWIESVNGGEWMSFLDDFSQSPTHADSVGFQVFLNNVEIYSGLEANNAAVTINVLTGEVV